MNTSRTKSIVVGLLAGITLATAVYAQTGKGMPMDSKNGMGKIGANSMMGMHGPMHMEGTGTMNGHNFSMTCDMTPAGKPTGGMGHDMTGHGMGKGDMKMDKSKMGQMNMNKPMKMNGTMTMMGQTYLCTMTMTPKGQ